MIPNIKVYAAQPYNYKFPRQSYYPIEDEFDPPNPQFYIGSDQLGPLDLQKYSSSSSLVYF